MSKYLIVTRHKPVADWFEAKGYKGKTLGVVRPKDVKGKIVCGCNIPAHILSFADGALLLNIVNETNKEFDDLTVEDIDNCKHQLRKYSVESSAIMLDSEVITDDESSNSIL